MIFVNNIFGISLFFHSGHKFVLGNLKNGTRMPSCYLLNCLGVNCINCTISSFKTTTKFISNDFFFSHDFFAGIFLVVMINKAMIYLIPSFFYFSSVFYLCRLPF